MMDFLVVPSIDILIQQFPACVRSPEMEFPVNLSVAIAIIVGDPFFWCAIDPGGAATAN